MINTRLVIALEELFKDFPDEIENIIIEANRGSIIVTEKEED